MDNVNVDTLKEYDRNPRQITDDEFQSLCDNLIKYGFLDPLVIDQDNIVLGGNQRLRAAKHLISQGYKDFNEVPIYRIETTDDEHQARVNLLLNNHHGSYDLDALAGLIGDLDIDLDDLDGLGFDESVLDGLDTGLSERQIEEVGEILNKEIIPFTQSHILISFDPQKLMQIQDIINKLNGIEGIEIEQASN